MNPTNEGFEFTSTSGLIRFTLEPFADEQAMTLAAELDIAVHVLQKVARGMWDAIEVSSL